MSWLLTGLVYVGRSAPIMQSFEQKFGKTVSKQYLSELRNDPVNRELFEKMANEYEKGMTREYLSSKRKRVNALTEIYEIAMDYKAYKLAKECITAIDEIMENSNRRGNLAILQFKQVNNYADMPLSEIRKEKVRLLKQLEDVKMISGNIEIDDSSTIEVENVEESQ